MKDGLLTVSSGLSRAHLCDNLGLQVEEPGAGALPDRHCSICEGSPASAPAGPASPPCRPRRSPPRAPRRPPPPAQAEVRHSGALPGYDWRRVTHGTSPLPNAKVDASLGGRSLSHQELLRRSVSAVSTHDHVLLSSVKGKQLC